MHVCVSHRYMYLKYAQITKDISDIIIANTFIMSKDQLEHIGRPDQGFNCPLIKSSI